MSSASVTNGINSLLSDLLFAACVQVLPSCLSDCNQENSPVSYKQHTGGRLHHSPPLHFILCKHGRDDKFTLSFLYPVTHCFILSPHNDIRVCHQCRLSVSLLICCTLLMLLSDLSRSSALWHFQNQNQDQFAVDGDATEELFQSIQHMETKI